LATCFFVCIRLLRFLLFANLLINTRLDKLLNSSAKLIELLSPFLSLSLSFSFQYRVYRQEQEQTNYYYSVYIIKHIYVFHSFIQERWCNWILRQMTCQKSHRSNGTFSYATPPTRIKHLTEYMSTLPTLYLFFLINKAKLCKKKRNIFTVEESNFKWYEWIKFVSIAWKTNIYFYDKFSMYFMSSILCINRFKLPYFRYLKEQYINSFNVIFFSFLQFYLLLSFLMSVIFHGYYMDWTLCPVPVSIWCIIFMYETLVMRETHIVLYFDGNTKVNLVHFIRKINISY
jgi:hypothetical protein